MVIVDTSVWIPALRDRTSPEKAEVSVLIRDGRAVILGLILAEVLRGARNKGDFDELQDELLAARFFDSTFEPWSKACEIMLDLRLRGETIPLADAVIAGHALVGDHEVYTQDRHFARITGLKLYKAQSSAQ